MNQINALLLVDKPAGMTSHGVVSRLKRLLRPERIGHLGTLDPFATGLLPIMLGGATRLADKVMDEQKGYRFEITFGYETSTLDPSGQVVREANTAQVSAEGLQKAIANNFLGEIEQTPPAYSALKFNGRPLYEYMRAEGSLPFDLELKRRKIKIFDFTLESFCPEVAGPNHHCPPSAVLHVRCSKGTYVRCLARDLALALQSAGTCTALRRTQVAQWHVDNANILCWQDFLQLPESEQESRVLQSLCNLTEMVPHLPKYAISSAEHIKLMQSGNSFQISESEILVTTGTDKNVQDSYPLVTLPNFFANLCDKPTPILLQGGKHLFLAEISIVCNTSKEGCFKIQPRKLLDW